MLYKSLLNDWNNRAEFVFDSFLKYLIGAGAFPLNLPDIAMAQQEEEAVTRYLLNSPERFKLLTATIASATESIMDKGKTYYLPSLLS
jgi:hypothetical protein